MNFLRNIFRANYWLQEIDNSQLVLMRIILGLVIAIDAFGGMATGWTYRAFIEPDFTFTFMGFEWLQVFVGKPMYVIYTVFGICGLLIAFGAYYRVAAVGAAVTWTMIYFAQKTNYNNHYYLLMLLCWLLVFLPANRYFAYDVKRRPEIKSLTAPRWTVYIFIVQLLIVYTFASIAKMYPGWIAGEPMEIWFKMKENLPIIGSLLQDFHTHKFVGLGGILFDLLVIPALLWKPTRWLAVVASFGFHIFNSIVFQVGTFPYLMIGTLILFFSPEQIRQTFFKKKPSVEIPSLPVVAFAKRSAKDKVILSLLTFHFIVQLILPLRHHAFQDSVMWNEEGHRYAWRMMLRAKSGYVTLNVIDNETGAKYLVRPADYVSSKQAWSLAIHPDMFWQFIQVVKQDYADKGMTNISIYADSKIKVNKGRLHTFIDPEYDLAKAEWHYFKHSEWILPEPEDFVY